VKKGVGDHHDTRKFAQTEKEQKKKSATETHRAFQTGRKGKEMNTVNSGKREKKSEGFAPHHPTKGSGGKARKK